jgi:chromosome segregation ATPase
MQEIEARMESASEKLTEKVKEVKALEIKLESTTTLLSEGSISNSRIQKELTDNIGKVESDLLYKTSKLDTALFEVERLKIVNKESIAVREEFDELKEASEKLGQVKLDLQKGLDEARAECDALAIQLNAASGNKELEDQNLIMKAEIDGLQIHNKDLARRVEASAGELDEMAGKADKARESISVELESKTAAYKELESTVCSSYCITY